MKSVLVQHLSTKEGDLNFEIVKILEFNETKVHSLLIIYFDMYDQNQ